MMNRPPKMVIVAGAVLGIACVGVGVWFTMALAESQQKNSERISAQNELDRLCNEKVSPHISNIERTQEAQQALESWIAAATNQLAKSDVPLTAATPAKFKSDLEDAIRELVSQGAVQGQASRVAPDFRFGFDKYKGDVLPETPDVARLNQQLDIIKLLAAELYEANVVRLEAITREVFESGATKDDSSAPPVSRRASRNKPQTTGGTASAAARPAAAGATDLFDSQRFSVTFLAYPDTFVDVLNRLATMDIFVVVAEVEVKKTGDSIVRGSGDKKDSAGARPAAADPFADAEAQPAVRVVTNPLDELPVNVRLVLDVYSFKGV